MDPQPLSFDQVLLIRRCVISHSRLLEWTLSQPFFPGTDLTGALALFFNLGRRLM